MDQNCCYAATGGVSWSQQYKSDAAPAAAAVSNESSSSFLVPWPPPPPHVSSTNQFRFYGLPPNSWSSMAADGFEDDRDASASKSHRQAEKRRRDRISAQLATLRKLIPKSDKMDKAALLGSVIDHVKELKRKAGEASEASEASEAFMVPTEVDEVTIDCDTAHGVTSTTTSNTNINRGNFLITASVCCDDRPELFSELIQILKGLKLTAVRADMASVGGRIKSVLVLRSKDGEEAVCLSTLKQSLKLVLSELAASPMAPNCRIRSKRQRFFFPCHDPN